MISLLLWKYEGSGHVVVVGCPEVL